VSKGKPPKRLVAAIAALETALASAGVAHVLIGGVAIIVRGVARTTRDVDATVAGDAISVPALLGALASEGIGARVDDPVGFALRTQVVLVRHEASGVDIDLSLAWMPFEQEAIAAGEVVRIARDVRARVARAEDLLVYKVVGWREIDRADLRELLALHVDRVDLERVRALVAVLAEVLEDPSRITEFDRMVREARRM
jgi:hypothetical protein